MFNKEIATFIFYNKSHGKQAKLAFSKDLVHCNVIMDDGKTLIMIMYERTGLIVRPIYKSNESGLIFTHLPKMKNLSAFIETEIHYRKKFPWFPWWARSCNEICRYASGIDVGFTFNPRHLYSKLLKYDGIRNYQVLSQWRREDELSIRRSDGGAGGTGSKSGAKS